MGFTTGFLGGLTLTYSVLYLTLYVHRSNRQIQHTVLSQQSVLLNSVAEPLPPLPEPPAYDVRKVSLTETLKDRWNAEIEGLVRRAEETDWNAVRERWEGRLGSVWGKLQAGEVAQRLNDAVAGTTEEMKRRAEESTQPTRLLEEK